VYAYVCIISIASILEYLWFAELLIAPCTILNSQKRLRINDLAFSVIVSQIQVASEVG
jgi:hypothetical protein